MPTAIGILVATLTLLAPALAEECSYAFRNYQNYRTHCAAGDGCVHLRASEQLARTACGGMLPNDAIQPAAAPAPTPPPLPPVSSTHDCEYLTSRYWQTANSPRADESSLAMKRKIAEMACGGPLVGAKEPEPPASCEELLRYRTEVLPTEWRKVYEKLATYNDARIDLLALKADLENEQKWIGPWRELSAYIVKPVDTAGKLIENSLYFSPVTGRMARVASTARTVTHHVVNNLSTAVDLSSSTLTEFYTNLALQMGRDQTLSPIVAATKTVWDLAHDIKTMVDMPHDFAKTRHELAQAMARLDANLAQIDGKIQTEMSSQRAIDLPLIRRTPF